MELIKELEKQKQKDFKELPENFLLQEVNQLLLSASSVENDVINKLGMIQNNPIEKKLKDDYVRTKKSEEIYNTSSFTGKQIKNLCDEYDLKCLQLTYFKGAYPPEMLRKINEFALENNIQISQTDWFIIAPSESFELQKHIPKPIDPIVLYRTDRNNSGWHAHEDDNFVQVYNWGNDFMWHRKVNFMFNTYTSQSDDWTNLASTFAGILIMIIGMLCTYFGKTMLPIIGSSLFFLFQAYNSKYYSVKNSQWNTNKY